MGNKVLFGVAATSVALLGTYAVDLFYMGGDWIPLAGATLIAGAVAAKIIFPNA
jgi:hypothetical protein